MTCSSRFLRSSIVILLPVEERTKGGAVVGADASVEVEQAAVVGARDQFPVDGALAQSLVREFQDVEVVLLVELQAALEVFGLEIFGDGLKLRLAQIGRASCRERV